MSLSITPQQRDALYAQVLDHLGGIDDVRLAAEREDFDLADRLGRAFDDDLRLILDVLGWGDHASEPVELGLPAEELARVLRNLRARAVEQIEAERGEQEAFRAMWERATLVRRTCDELLLELSS